MATINYKMIIIEGWINDTTGHLSDYFYRELKKLESEFYSLDEANRNMQGIITQLKQQSEKHYYNQLNLWYQYEAQQIAKGEKVEAEKPAIENFRQSIPLYYLTAGKYAGHISFDDIEYIESHINFACAKIRKEKITDEINKLEKLVANRTKKKSENQKIYQSLKDIFISDEAYTKIMDQLVKDKLIDEKSYEWINKEKGHKTKVVALLYHLYYNHYFKCDQMPSPQQIQLLAKKGFNIEIGIRTINTKEKTNSARSEFSFIKQFSSSLLK